MKIKKSLIIQEAKEIKDYIEKNKKLPKVNTINNNIYSIFQTSYLLGKMIQNNFKADEYIVYTNVILYNTPKSYVDTINEKVLKDDYLKMINNFLNYCNINRRVPQYITTQKTKTKVSYELFVYCIAKIVVFFKENNYLPNYCTFNKSDLSNTKKVTISVQKEVKQSTSTSKKTNNCTNPYISEPHLTGSDLGQDTSYGCANNAEQQALYKLLGKIYKESELAKLSATTTNGTSHQGIETCIAAISKKTGIKLTVKWMYFSDLGNTIEERFEALGKIICQPNKAVITHIKYINGGEDEATSTNKGFGHYEGIESIDTKNKVVTVLNSLGLKKPNGGYVGKVQKRPYKVEASYLRYTPGGQKAICVITKG